PKKIEHSAHHDGCPYFETPRGNTCSDRVRRVCPAVYKNNSQREQDCDHKDRVGKNLLTETRKCNVHNTLLFHLHMDNLFLRKKTAFGKQNVLCASCAQVLY